MTVTLWRAYVDYKDFKLESFEVDEKPQTYRTVDRHGISATGWSSVIHKDEIGRKYFLTAPEALQSFIVTCQSKIDWYINEIDQGQKRMALAQAKLEEISHG